MTCPAKSIKDVHNITSFYLLICAHKVVIFIPFNFYSHFPCFFCIYFKSFYPMLHSLFFWSLLSVSVWVRLILQRIIKAELTPGLGSIKYFIAQVLLFQGLFHHISAIYLQS